MDETDRNCALAYRRSNPADGRVAHVPSGKNARYAGLKQERIPLQLPVFRSAFEMVKVLAKLGRRSREEGL